MYLHLPILLFEIYISSYHKDKRKEDTLFQKVSSRRCDYLFTYFEFYSRLYIATLILKRDYEKRRMVMTIAPSFLVYAGLYTAHLISAESSVTSIRSMNCAATIFFSSKLKSEKTSFSGIAGLDFSRLHEARISFRSFSRRASAR